MYKILLVDDESTVRESIKKNTKWESMGFDLVDDCEDGAGAMRSVDKYQPDVVITDICMPIMDGLELSRCLVRKYPNIHVIILTGYDEFEYARQAVKLKAYDFILKPITPQELRNVLLKLKTELDRESEARETFSQVHDNLPYLREHMLNRLCAGEVSYQAAKKEIRMYGMNFQGALFTAFVVDIDSAGPPDRVSLYAVQNICSEIVARFASGFVFRDSANRTVAVLNGTDAGPLLKKSVAIAEEIRAVIEKYLEFTVCVGVSRVCRGGDSMPDIYQQASYAVSQRFFQGKNRVISYQDDPRDEETGDFNRLEYEKSLSEAIKSGTAEEADLVISEFMRRLRMGGMTPKACGSHLQSLTMAAANTAESLGATEAEIWGDGGNGGAEMPIRDFKTLEEMQSWLREFCRRCNQVILRRRENSAEKQAIDAVRYIENHYADETISLNSLCKTLSVSISYFSKCFRNYTGVTFVEYLTRVRMTKARELLKTTDLKTYEVAYRVGYSDAHYFAMIFKKSNYMTPTEYREGMRC